MTGPWLIAFLALSAGDPIQAQASRPLTLHLVGDSTMGEDLKDRDPETGWGERLRDFLDERRVRVLNHSRRGVSTRTFLGEGHWDRALAGMRTGDMAIVQFGHNDGSSDEEETPPDLYRKNLTRFVDDLRLRGVSPVLATPIVRRRFDGNGALVDTHGPYPAFVKSVAFRAGVPLLDMQRVSADIVRRAGREGSRLLFLHLAPGEHPNYPGGHSDNVHLSPEGAGQIARAATEEMRAMKLPISLPSR